MTFSDPAFRVRLLSRDAPAEAIEAAAQVLTEAFHGSSLEAIWGGDNAELAQARNVEFVTTTVLDLECYVAESVADGAIVGVMLVKPRGFEHRKSPNTTGPHSERVAKMMIDYPEIQAQIDQLVVQVSELKKEAFGDKADLRHLWYISHLGAAPSWKGKGVGAALLRHLQKRIDGERVALLAISAQLVEWYAHFGFKPLGDRAFLVGDPAIDVHFWALCT